MLGLHRERMLMKYPHVSELLAQRWYVVVNDVVGGWSVCNVDKPISQQDPKNGEWEIADFVARDDAEAIVAEHNLRLDGHEQQRPAAG
jgi:hypothetical protein